MKMFLQCVCVATVWLVLGSLVCGQATTLNENRKLLAHDGAAGDLFGCSVAFVAGAVAVGSTGSDATIADQGAVYVLNPTTGEQIHKLLAEDPGNDDGFGFSVSMSENQVIVGAPKSDDGGDSAGSAYVFNLASGVQQFKFVNPETSPSLHEFGYAVAIDGTTALVGARSGNSGAPGDDEGAAYVYDVSSGACLFKQLPSDPYKYDNYGTSVAVSGNRGLVGAPFDDDNMKENSGSVYVVDLNPSTHGLELRKLRALDPAKIDELGQAVALEGTLAVVGVPGDDALPFSRRGSVYGFDISTGTEIFKLTPGEADEDEQFGTSVAIDGNLIAVGAPGDDACRGAVYVFDATTHAKLFKLVASDAAADDQLGASVAIVGRTIVAGASGDDPGGAAYLFTLPETSRIPGDTNHDGHVDQTDARTLASYWGEDNATWEMGDFNDDRVIGPADASILAAHWGYPHGESGTAPEPGVLALLAGGLVGLIRVRRR